MHMCFPFQKKLHLDFFSFLFVQHSLHQIPCKSLWDLTCLVSWGDKCFLCDELGLTGMLPSVQPNYFGAIEAYNLMLPISLQERQLATYSCIHFCSSSTQWLLSSTSIVFDLLLCSATQGPNPSWQKSRSTLLGNWCQRGRERSSHQSLIIS